MKGLQFFGNRVEDAANAFIDVLKYSDQSVTYPDFKDIDPWPDEIINMFYVIWKNAKFSELSAIIMYTQQSSRFEEVSELMLGKGLYYKDIAKRLGVSVGTIGRVINKKSYRDENIDRKR